MQKMFGLLCRKIHRVSLKKVDIGVLWMFVFLYVHPRKDDDFRCGATLQHFQQSKLPRKTASSFMKIVQAGLGMIRFKNDRIRKF